MDVILDGMEAVPQALSDLTGAEISGTRLFATLLFVYPITIIRRLFLEGANPNIIHVYYTVTGAFLMYFNFGVLSSLFLINILIIYVLLVLLKSSKYAVILSFIINMTYLCYGYMDSLMHEVRYVVSWTTPLCVLTLKLIGLTWDVYDGGQKDQKGKENTALSEVPSLLEMLGFAYYPPGLMTGPQIPFRKYKSFVEGAFNEHLKSNWVHALFKLLLGIILIVAYPMLSSHMPTNYFYTQEYKDSLYIMKMISLAVWGQIILTRYLGVWLVAEGSCILSGLAYNGKDENGNIQWDGCANVKLVRFYTATHSQHIIDSFNINTNKWVLTYIYKRLRFLNNKQISQGASLLFLAVWHGLELGYFMNFFLEFLIMNGENQIALLFQRKTLLKNLIANPVFRLLCKPVTKLLTSFTLGYALISFEQFRVSAFHPVYMNTYYLPHIFYLAWPLTYMVLNNLLKTDKLPANGKKEN